MNTENRLYNLEIEPPANIWNKIVADLDSSEMAATFPARLRDVAIVPPTSVWNKIESTLEGSSLIHDFGKKLDQIAIIPPANTWNKITTQLDSTQKESGKLIPWIRYAAAAAIIALIAWAGSRYLTNNTRSQDVIINNNLPSTTSPGIAIEQKEISADKSSIPVAVTDDTRNDAALEASKKTFAKLDVPRSGKIKNAANFYFIAENDEELTTSIPDYGEEELQNANTNNRYIVLMTPEGNIIRMSKKLSDLVCCVSGEIEEKDCVDQMKKWREKIAYTTAGHSPGNFLEIVNLVCSLQED